jgi:hypothetical protein
MPANVSKVQTSPKHLLGGAAMVRTAFTSLTVTACLLVLTACNGDDPGTPTPTPTLSTSPTSASASPSKPVVPPYLADYTAGGRAAYARAINAYKAFSVKQAQFNAAGEATHEAEVFYRR